MAPLAPFAARAEAAMTDEQDKPQIIDLADPANVEYWCRVWGVSEADLRQAVEKAGPEVPAVAFALKKEAY
jgi:hypothetical protein